MCSLASFITVGVLEKESVSDNRAPADKMREARCPLMKGNQGIKEKKSNVQSSLLPVCILHLN